MSTTPNIPDRLLISAPNDGGLFYAHQQDVLTLSREDATGMALLPDGIAWCAQADGSRVLRRVSAGVLQDVALASEPLDLHDVLMTPNGLHAVFTETNEIAHLDDAFNVTQRWCFADEPDSVHVNCIAWFDGRLVASLFGRFATHRGYKGATRGAGQVIDVATGQCLIAGLSQPHSLVVDGDELWLCSSEEGSVRVYDRQWQLLRTLSLPGYTRGLALGGQFVYVGLSRSRNRVADGDESFASAVVAVLDRLTLEVVGHLPLPCNEVYDIRVAPSAERVGEIASALAQESLETVKSLRGHEMLLASARDELARVTREASDEITRMMGEVATIEAASREQITCMMAAVAAANAASGAATERAETLQAELAEVRGEVVKRDARIHVLDQARAELELVKASRSWRWTRPVRFAARTIRHRGLHEEDRRTLFGAPSASDAASSPAGAMAAPHAPDSDVPVPAIAPAEPSAGLRDYFVWAVIDWHFRTQRPQHLSRELAASGHRVFYISNNFVDSAEPGFRVEPLDDSGRLFQINLHLQGSPAIYHAVPDEMALEQLRSGLGLLLAWTRSRACVSLVQHPYWLEMARILPNLQVVYDCMDHHGGFADNSDAVLERERELMIHADLLVVTSSWLDAEAARCNERRLIVRNACEFSHFAAAPTTAFADAQGRKVIGYYGAIAEWFDLKLVEKLARHFSDCLVLLVGADTCGAQQRLRELPNVAFTGEVTYARLPHYLAGFDVCLLPFQVIPLTLATNPVKVYEYLSAGKHVVSVDLPELRQFGELVRIAAEHDDFIKAVDAALRVPPDADQIARRQAFAAEQTWAHRVLELDRGISELPQPRVSVVVVTYNNLDLTQACLHSLDRYSDYANLELIVVDNASTDGTPEYLRTWAGQGSDRRIVLNDDNRGFAAANNQGLALADGDYLVMLNNDTYVTPGWIATLVGHLRRDGSLGMLGPVTNNIGNEARIDIGYADMDEMLQRAGDHTRRHVGELTPLRTAAFFCVMMPRAVYEKVGPLDEAFGIGFFEDDDYCRRVEQAGWRIACADDVFIHHNLSASFNKLKQEWRQALFERNRAIYEAKWGAWAPHRYRDE